MLTHAKFLCLDKHTYTSKYTCTHSLSRTVYTNTLIRPSFSGRRDVKLAVQVEDTITLAEDQTLSIQRSSFCYLYNPYLTHTVIVTQ